MSSKLAMISTRKWCLCRKQQGIIGSRVAMMAFSRARCSGTKNSERALGKVAWISLKEFPSTRVLTRSLRLHLWESRL